MLTGAMRSGMKRSLVFARRHVSKLIYAVALIGVPLAVVYGTGGLHTIGFWAMALIWLPVAIIGLGPFLFLLVLPLVPIFYIIDKLLSGWLAENIEKLMPAFWGIAALVAYVLGPDLGYTGDVWLPTPWPNVGAVVVMALASTAFAGLMWLGGILEAWEPRGHRGLWSDVAEPEEEFWSDEVVEGWRAWRWENGHLHGVFDTWRSKEFKAKCWECREVPGWEHTCGIYAVKHPRPVSRFQGTIEVVGRVEMWGSVIEHEHGYRAEKARITDLWVVSAPLAREISSQYEVDVHVGSPTVARGC